MPRCTLCAVPSKPFRAIGGLHILRAHRILWKVLSPKVQTWDVKFSGCTFSQILYTRQDISRPGKYTAYGIRASHTCRTWDRYFLVGIVSLYSRNVRQGQGTRDIPIHISFRPPQGNELSLSVTIELQKLLYCSSFSRTSFAPLLDPRHSFSPSSSLVRNLFSFYFTRLLHIRCIEEMKFLTSLWIYSISAKFRENEGIFCLILVILERFAPNSLGRK